MDKKSSFWILVILFGFLTLAGLFANRQNLSEQMTGMGLSMGGMMKVHHAGQITPAILLRQGAEDHGMGNLSGHHLLTSLLEGMAFLTTVAIFLLVPILAGGVVLLLVLWF
ncbi:MULTISPECIES: hypothetical protein [Carboxydocella]|uniref:Uncharacterized protein n=2 Tax=Carboxydocella TaxID=178898 RepID=A0A1T4PFP3_9FIRM|nr:MULTISPECIES: hypothetical protein [Carboxydocella]AVX21448.1 hypothetical protein CFE_2305 [Carboxydocella thermautotrophica]AVX31936.1 hypothetical protein CTH_2397 [Carboxydocella thermautotrophica]SJZ90393.1 hypothetical protein SAMN02745885_01260 [Carboxydocella sporoproducens DSM 16521]GAW28750.1 hypothetical protein ULO1_13200 [Carboxydocella sp. ULO1]GAW32582.1 hypothetical protein JDF658_23470 [Carboxydocella sp. JDF658]